MYCTSFCNRNHRLTDGKPIDHECYIIPPRLLIAERDDAPDRDDLWSHWSEHGPRWVHRGVKKK